MYQNKRVSYFIHGEGKPVMLVHGFGEDHKIWNLQLDHLKKSFLLILPDLPGSGNSELIEDLSMENLADVLHAVIEAESIESIIIIGHSMGGYITLAFAEKYPNLLKGFGLFHSMAYPDSEEKKQNRLKAIEFIKKNGVEEFLKTSTPNLFAKETVDKQGDRNEQKSHLSKAEMIQKLIRQYADMDPKALVGYYKAMMARPDRTEVLKKFTKPILFTLGQYDTAVPFEQGLQQTELALLSDVQVLHNSGHMGMWEEPEESSFILEDFVKNNVI